MITLIRISRVVTQKWLWWKVDCMDLGMHFLRFLLHASESISCIIIWRIQVLKHGDPLICFVTTESLSGIMKRAYRKLPVMVLKCLTER